jgi:hypothetical protein
MKKSGIIITFILIVIILLKVLGDIYYQHNMEITSSSVNLVK